MADQWESLESHITPQTNTGGQWESLPDHIGDSPTGSPFVDAVISNATAPLNPHNWLDVIKQTVDDPWKSQFKQEDYDKAKSLLDASHKRQSLYPLLTGKENGTGEDLAGGVTGDAIAAAVLGTTAHILSKAAPTFGKLTSADPVKDYIDLYGTRDPRAPERIPTALADIKEYSPVMITHNEHLASTSPDEIIKNGALAANRQAMDDWHYPVQRAGYTASPTNIIQATANSLKAMDDPERRAALLSEAQNKLTQEPLTPDRLRTLLEEKNGELQSFYSRDPSTQEAAKQAGAVSGRSQALLEAQAQAIRDTYYNLLDPEFQGARPREIQQRYGGIKMVQNDATDNRTKILAETKGTQLGKVLETTISVPELAMSPLKEGGAFKAIQDIRGIWKGKSNPTIKRMFNNAPEYTPLPEAPPIEQRYPNMTRQLPAAATPMPGVADTSSVRGVPAMSQPPNTTRALPAASTIFQGDTGPGSGLPSAPSKTLPNVPDVSHVRAVAAELANKTEDGIAQKLGLGRSYSQLSMGQRQIVDKVKSGGRLSLSDLSNLGNIR